MYNTGQLKQRLTHFLLLQRPSVSWPPQGLNFEKAIRRTVGDDWEEYSVRILNVHGKNKIDKI